MFSFFVQLLIFIIFLQVFITTSTFTVVFWLFTLTTMFVIQSVAYVTSSTLRVYLVIGKSCGKYIFTYLTDNVVWLAENKNGDCIKKKATCVSGRKKTSCLESLRDSGFPCRFSIKSVLAQNKKKCQMRRRRQRTWNKKNQLFGKGSFEPTSRI